MLCPDTDDLFQLNLQICLVDVLSSQCVALNRTVAGILSGSCVTVSCVLVVICTVGPLQDHNGNKMSRCLTWCSEEVKFRIDIWADEHVSQMLDTRHRTRNQICGKTTIHIKTQNHVGHFSWLARLCFDCKRTESNQDHSFQEISAQLFCSTPE